MKDYWIFSGKDHSDLSALVKQNLKLGWRPHGGAYTDAKGRHYQAMVKGASARR